MRVISSIRSAFANMKNNLTRINREEPLGRLSLAVIILLDLFILFSVFKGLAEHTAQLAAPDEYFPYACRDILLTEEGSDRQAVSSLAGKILEYDESDVPGGNSVKQDAHPLCMRLNAAVGRVHARKDLVAVIKEINWINNELSRVRDEIKENKPAYDTWLLESVADKRAPGEEKQVSNIRSIMQAKMARQDELLARKAGLEKHMAGDPAIRGLQRDIREMQKQSAGLKKEYESAVFWFPVKRLCMQFLFLVPLLAVFYWWYSRSAKKERGLQTLVSSHLLVVTCIPVLVKLFEMAFDIIPKKLLKAVWDLLVSLRLIAIWHYLIIALTTFLALVLVYALQKKVFSRERLIARRISKGQCQDCGRKLPVNAVFCPLCGYAQYTKCGACGEQTFANGAFCARCGIRREGMSS